VSRAGGTLASGRRWNDGCAVWGLSGGVARSAADRRVRGRGCVVGCWPAPAEIRFGRSGLVGVDAGQERVSACLDPSRSHRDPGERLRRSTFGGPVQGGTEVPGFASEGPTRQHRESWSQTTSICLLSARLMPTIVFSNGTSSRSRASRALRFRSPPRHAVTDVPPPGTTRRTSLHAALRAEPDHAALRAEPMRARFGRAGCPQVTGSEEMRCGVRSVVSSLVALRRVIDDQEQQQGHKSQHD
jgi:hypothetical protein